MSDHEYLRDLFGSSPQEGHDLVDIILEQDEKELMTEQEDITLNAGKIVHLIWLTTSSPAKVMKVAFYITLQDTLHFKGFNHLTHETLDNPGSWFVNKGFTVRSKKANGNWLQCIFPGNSVVNLTRSEIIEYLQNVAKMDFKEFDINDEFSPTIVERNDAG